MHPISGVDVIGFPQEGAQMSFERGPYLSLAVFCEKAIQSKEGLLSVINVSVQTVDIVASLPQVDFE